MNIYLREIKANFKSLLVWSATMVFLVLAGMMKYSAFQKTGEAVNAMFNQMPAGILAVMGISADQDLTSVGVFYSIFFLYFLLLMTVHSSMLGVTVIAKEERDKTADFLLVKPIRRSCAITAKILAAITLVIAYNLVTFISSAMIVKPFNDTGTSLTGPIFYLTSCLLVIQILFLGLGLLFGALARTSEKASGMATAVILGTFILKILIDLKADLDYLDFLTPFRYFKAIDVMYKQEISIPYVILSVVLAGTAMAGTYWLYQKRDLHS
ncbi:MAG: ABC transporter permease subunit [Eubacteriales bacterium]|nr:ABC transporter permease subunit [Eubacteriales bacterium]